MGELGQIQPDLHSRRLLLRRLRQSDANFIRTHAGDAQVALNLAVVPHPYPEGAAEDFIARCLAPDAREMAWLIQYGPEGHEISVGVISLKRDETDGTGSLGYWVAPWLWGFGFATEAVEAVVDHARKTGFPRLDAEIHEGNARSARVLEKAGFRQDGTGESHSLARGGMVPVIHYLLVLEQA